MCKCLDRFPHDGGFSSINESQLIGFRFRKLYLSPGGNLRYVRATWLESKAEQGTCCSDDACFMFLAMALITREVRAMGQRSFRASGRCSCELWNKVRNTPPSFWAQCLRTQLLMLFEPGELLSLVLLKAFTTSWVLKMSAELLGLSVDLISSRLGDVVWLKSGVKAVEVIREGLRAATLPEWCWGGGSSSRRGHDFESLPSWAEVPFDEFLLHFVLICQLDLSVDFCFFQFWASEENPLLVRVHPWALWWCRVCCWVRWWLFLMGWCCPHRMSCMM